MFQVRCKMQTFAPKKKVENNQIKINDSLMKANWKKVNELKVNTSNKK